MGADVCAHFHNLYFLQNVNFHFPTVIFEISRLQIQTFQKVRYPDLPTFSEFQIRRYGKLYFSKTFQYFL